MAKRTMAWFAPDARNRGLYSSEDLTAMTLIKDGLEVFKTRWDNTLVGLRAVPSDDVKLALFLRQLRKSRRMRTQIEAWERLPPVSMAYEWLRGAWRREISNERNQRHRRQTQEALNAAGLEEHKSASQPQEDE